MNKADIGCINQSSPIKKNVFDRFYHHDALHTITSLYPIILQSLWLATWNWLLECLRHMPHESGL